MKRDESAAILRDYLTELRTAALDDAVPAPVMEALEVAVAALNEVKEAGDVS